MTLRHPPLQPGWIEQPHRRLDLGDFILESGDVIRDAHLCYVVHGDVAPTGDAGTADPRTDPPLHGGKPAILVTTAIGSTHHRLDFLIGPGRALDTSRHRIVAVDALGNGLSSSPSNSTAQPGARFPRFSIRDMVESQRYFLDALGIGPLHAVVGASMGGMQALQWAVSHPRRMRKVVAMTPMARTARWSQLVNEAARRALFLDAACTRPRPANDAWRLWTPIAQAMVPRSPDAMASYETQADMLQWLDQRAAWHAAHGPDPYDWAWQSFAYDAHDVGGTPGFGGNLAAALQSIEAESLILTPPLDLYNPVADARQAALLAGARHLEIPSRAGHQAASGVERADVALLQRSIGAFLAS